MGLLSCDNGVVVDGFVETPWGVVRGLCFGVLGVWLGGVVVGDWSGLCGVMSGVGLDVVVERLWGLRVCDPCGGCDVFVDCFVDVLVDCFGFCGVCVSREELLGTVFTVVELNPELVVDSVLGDERYLVDRFVGDFLVDYVPPVDGFDIVIGNPPYVRQELLDKDFKAVLMDEFSVGNGYLDLCGYFFERGLGLLKPDGVLGFVCSNTFHKTFYARKLREFVAPYLVGVRDLGDTAFKESVNTALYYCRNSENTTVDVDGVMLTRDMIDNRSWIFLDKPRQELFEKINSMSTPLGDCDGVSHNLGLKSGFDKAFRLSVDERYELLSTDECCRSFIYPSLRGRNLNRYGFTVKEYFLRVPKGTELPEDHPVVQYLSQYKERLGKRCNIKQWYAWANKMYQRLTDAVLLPEYIYKKPKVAVISDSNEIICLDTIHILKLDSMNSKAMAMLFSSDLYNWYMNKIGKPVQQTIELNSFMTLKLPIPVLTLEEEERLVELYDLLESYSETVKDKTDLLEYEVNQIVFNIYHVTSDEMNLIYKDLGEQ